ncbi:acetyl-CoA carboxylase biotin carboxyl carrier protein [Aeribacillus composti]|uniref:Biotin carboxyl carrier protein of acetyl-CoA carboxylase n=1 Tax=Aeribacillus pallidus TaxID=33936 RepID=A0A223E9C6_9BACI|nr:acetyl-CoA carboxylase biotin carboxyl carrier protein [Aeribacillus pallidus]ASS91864.1 acetyl-CoA carboxylase, biotin carboxyl carrier protein [Aeribacillus pallidus]
MLNFKEIKEIIKLIDDSSIDEFTYESEGAKVQLKKTAARANQHVVYNNASEIQALPKQPAAESLEQPKKEVHLPKEESEQETENLHKITSPMVGTFYAAPNPDADPYVTIGSKVKENTVVCIVEAMKLFNEIEAEVKGEIVDILVENGQLVEYGQPLFLVKPE